MTLHQSIPIIESGGCSDGLGKTDGLLWAVDNSRMNNSYSIILRDRLVSPRVKAG